MNPIALFLGALASVLNNRGHGDLADYADLAALLVQEVGEASDEWKELAAEMQAHQAAGTDPSLAQRQAVKDRRAELSAAIQATGEEATPPDGPPEE